MSSETTTAAPSRKRWIALGFMSLGVSMVMIDANIVNVSIPVISRDLALTPTDIEWVNSIYALVFASLLITMGKAGDVVGRRLVFMLGAAIFLVSSLIAARSNAGEVLIFGRFVQGIGGAMMIPASLSLLNSMFRGKERAIAFAVWGVTIGCVSALGPLLGGWLSTDFSWRWAFAINLPIALTLIVGTLLTVPESKDPTAQRGVDVIGVLTSAIGLGAVVFALIEGQRMGWITTVGEPSALGVDWHLGISPVPLAFVLGVVLIALFVAQQKRRAAAHKSALLDLELFRIGSFTWGQAVAMIVMFAEFGILLILPLYLQNVLGYTAVHAGGILALIMVGALISTPPSGKLVGRFGAIQVVRIGVTLEVFGMLGLGSAITVDAGTWTLAPWLILFGAGVGLSTAQITNVILRDVPVHKSGQASGTQSTTRQLGVALGIAVLGAVMWISLSSLLSADLERQPGVTPAQAQQVTSQVLDSSGVALEELRRTDPVLSPIADDAFARATQRAAWVAAFFSLVALVGTFRIKPGSPARRPEDSLDDAAGDPDAGDEGPGRSEVASSAPTS